MSIDAALMGEAKDPRPHGSLELWFMPVLRSTQASAVENGDAESVAAIEAEAKAF